MSDEEQRLRDLMVYGPCWECGEPRRGVFEQGEGEHGEKWARTRLVCYAGHDADEVAPAEWLEPLEP